MFKALTFLGRYASYTLPVGVLFGLLLPQLSSFLKPLLLPALLIPLTLSLVRIHSNELKRSFSNWRLIIVLNLWSLIICPALVWLALQPFDIPEAITMAAIIAASAPPITACAAIATFLRIDAAISVVIAVTTMLVVPISFPFILELLVGLQVEVQLWLLSFRLCSFIFGAFALALVLKKWLGEKRIEHLSPTLDGISVISIGIFNIVIMNGVTALFLSQPGFVMQTLIVSSLVVMGLYLVSATVFWRYQGASKAMAIGLSSGNCNLGLMYIVLENQAPIELLIYFAIGQIPLYFLPTLLAPSVSKFLK